MPDRPLLTLLPALTADPPFSGAESWVAPIDSPQRADDFLQGFSLLHPRPRAVGLKRLDEFAGSLPNREEIRPHIATLRRMHRAGYFDPQVVETLRKNIQVAGSVGSIQAIKVEPLFRAGSIDFFQDDQSSWIPLSEGCEDRFFIPSIGGFLLSNEREDLWPQAVHSAGGTILGIGSFQTLNLAMAATEASAVGLIDVDPFVTFMRLLLLLLVPQMPNPRAYAEQAIQLAEPTVSTEVFTESIPERYQSAFSRYIDIFRDGGWLITRRLKRLLKKYLADPSSFLGSQKNYDRTSQMIRGGGVFIIYGNFWAACKMIDMIGSAVDGRDPIGVVYLSNMLDYDWAYKWEPGACPNLRYVLVGPHTETSGFLLSTANVLNVRSLLNVGGGGLVFTYHAIPLGEAGRILQASGTVRGLARHLQISRGLTASGSHGFTLPMGLPLALSLSHGLHGGPAERIRLHDENPVSALESRGYQTDRDVGAGFPRPQSDAIGGAKTAPLQDPLTVSLAKPIKASAADAMEVREWAAESVERNEEIPEGYEEAPGHFAYDGLDGYSSGLLPSAYSRFAMSPTLATPAFARSAAVFAVL